jgi:hypothetical protein
MVLGHKVEIHSSLIDEFHDLEMAGIKVRIGKIGAIVFLHVVKNADFHECHYYDNCVGLASGLRGAT